MSVDTLSSMLTDQERWEIRFGAINGAICLIEHYCRDVNERSEDQQKTLLHDFLWNFLLT